jgi:long-chain fatty acid transport protein
MAMPGTMFMDMAGFPGSTQTFGTVSGSMMDTFGCATMGGAGCPATIPPGMINPTDPVNWGRFDFSDDSAFSGKAKGTGFAGKIGVVYKVNSQLTLGATYHSKTALGDLEATGATVAFNANIDNNVLAGGAPTGAGYSARTIPIMGKIAIKDFQWPQTIGVGAAYNATDKLMIVADYKWINWESVMKNFQMTFSADPAAAQYNAFAMAFGGTTLNATLFQKWKDQNVFMLGAGYKATDQFTVRGGLNIANNPIPDQYLNSLFPAIVTTIHISCCAAGG